MNPLQWKRGLADAANQQILAVRGSEGARHRQFSGELAIHINLQSLIVLESGSNMAPLFQGQGILADQGVKLAGDRNLQAQMPKGIDPQGVANFAAALLLSSALINDRYPIP